MFTVALTGGIATGKSTVAHYFGKLGVSIIDADEIGRELIDGSSELRNQLAAYFGASVLKKNGAIDRDKLRAIIFAKPQDREYLELLLHPLIYQEINLSILKARGVYTLVTVPLLFENRTSQLLKKKPSSANYIRIDRILLLTTSRELQIQRAEKRDFLEKNQIDAILAAQISPADSIKRADDVISNVSNLKSLLKSVHAMHEKYLSLISSSKNSLDDSTFLGYYLVLK